MRGGYLHLLCDWIDGVGQRKMSPFVCYAAVGLGFGGGPGVASLNLNSPCGFVGPSGYSFHFDLACLCVREGHPYWSDFLSSSDN